MHVRCRRITLRHGGESGINLYVVARRLEIKKEGQSAGFFSLALAHATLIQRFTRICIKLRVDLTECSQQTLRAVDRGYEFALSHFVG